MSKGAAGRPAEAAAPVQGSRARREAEGESAHRGAAPGAEPGLLAQALSAL